jgi:hypothetical protein
MQKQTIYGIDISKGSPRGRELPRYALAILKDGKVSHQIMLRRPKIFNMIQRDKPEIIAVDNIFELAADRSELISLMERLPESIKLVQVTGGLHPESLVRIARKYGFSFDPKNPNDEAEACARLADLGVGYELSLFEDITKIKVSRARSLGRGGWSQNRYRRKVHGAVLQRSREIENVLRDLSREKGIIFEVVNVKGFGGYVRSEFTVYAKRGEIPIHSMASNDAQVIVKSVERDQIRYVPLIQKKLRRRFTIVGIDPGTTVGIAILSLDGDLLYLKSFRGIAPDKVVKLIAEYGKPALISSDVTPMPISVEKIRRSFNAVPASPGIEVSAEEKIALGKAFGYSNDHERDALAAALLTYRSYKNIFTRIEKKAQVDTDLELLKLYVIRGDSIEDAIEKIRAPGAVVNTRVQEIPENPGERVVDGSILKMRDIIQRQREQIQNLQTYLEELKKELVIKDKKTSKLESKLNGFKKEVYSEVRKSKEIKTRDEIIESLKKELSYKNKAVKELRHRSNKLRKIQKMEICGVGTPVKVITAFTKESIAETKEKYGLKEGDVVFLENPSGGGASTAHILVESKVKAVLIQEDISHAAEETFFKGDVPVLMGIPLERAEDFAITEPEGLKAAISAWEKEAEIKKRRAKEDQLKILFEEYRSERRRGLV